MSFGMMPGMAPPPGPLMPEFPPPTDIPFGPMPLDPLAIGPMGPAPMTLEGPAMQGMLAPPPPPPLDMAAIVQHYMGKVPGPMGKIFRPKWYKSPTVPDTATIIEMAREDQAEHQPWLQVIAQVFNRLSGSHHSVFEKDVSALQSKDVERYYSSAIMNEHHLAVSFLASKDMRVRAMHRDAVDKDDSRRKEDYLFNLRECFRRQHADSGNGDLEWDEAEMVCRYGMLTSFCCIDTEDPLCGMTYTLLDPTTVFPTFEGKHGLKRVTRVYRAKLAKVVGHWDEDGSVASQLYRKPATNERRRQRKAGDVVEVIEYYDTENRVLIVDGERIKTWKHNYGVVPIVVQYGTGGEPMWATSLSSDTISVPDGVGGYRNVLVAGSGSNRKNKALPYTFRMWKQHDQLEAMMSRVMTEFRRGGNPPYVIKRGMTSQNKPKPNIDVRDGARSYLNDDETLDVVPTSAPPHVTNMIQQVLQQDALTGRAPLASYGANPAANTSGSALQSLDRAGAHHWTGAIRTLEMYHRRCFEQFLVLYRDWGGILGQPGQRGVMLVPYKKPRLGMPGVFEITPDIIERTGYLVDVRLTRLPMDMLPGMVSAVIQLLDNNLIGLDYAYDLLDIEDPETMQEDVDERQLLEAPEMKQANMLKRISLKFARAKEIGDEEEAARLMWMGEYVAAELDATRAENAAGRAEKSGMASAPGPNPGAPNGPGGLPIPANQPGMPGTSLPQFGVQSGTNGGRPPGSGVQRVAPFPSGGGPAPMMM